MCGVLAPLLRDPLGEQRHDVGALGAQGLVEGGRDHPVAEGPLGRPGPRGRPGRPRSMYSIDGAISTEPVWCSGSVGAGVGGEVGELGESQVDLDHAAAGLPVLDVLDEVVGQVAARHVVEEGRLGVQGGHHHRCAGSPPRSRGPRPAPAARRPGCGRPGRRSGSRAPKLRADRSMAPATPPMPPSGNPQLPR